MKEGFDREIDTLLRRRARGAAQSLAGDGGARGASHLDADELGAFAEGALPAPARITAAAHLADCDECRGVVVALSRTLGGAAQSKGLAGLPASAEVLKPAGWRAWAAALFSPRTLRYAVPLLALSLVGVVSYVALRTRQQGGAANTARQASRPPAALKEQADIATATTEASNSNAGGLVEEKASVSGDTDRAAGAAAPPGRGGHGGAEGQPVTTDARADEAPAPAPTPAAQPALPPTAGTAAPAEIAKAAPKPDTAGEAELRRPAKSEGPVDKEKAGRAGEPKDEVAANDLASQQQRGVSNRAANEMQVQMPDDSRNQNRAPAKSAPGGYGGGAAAPKQAEREESGARARTARRGAAQAEQRAAEDDETVRAGETRAAAGHRFRREGNVWVDVNYRPSMSSTGVRRGTEPFRALVAEVPEVGRVAAQLGGEVIVVVRGRAYRIR